MKRDNLLRDKNDKKESKTIINRLEEKYNIKEKLAKNKKTFNNNHQLIDKGKKNNSISKSKFEKKSRTKSTLINKKRIIMNYLILFITYSKS